MKKIILTTIIALGLIQISNAKVGMALVKNENKIGKWYFTSMIDGNTFSWANIKGSGISNTRYTCFVNTGLHANYNLKRKLAFYTGLELRNMGYANRNIANNLRYRVSTTYIGMPLGVRIGDLKTKTEVIAGTGFDIPTYYKYKSWTIGDKKNKVRETESASGLLRTFNPYLFLGYKYHGMGVKFQYYPSSFYVSTAAIEANLFYLSLILSPSSGKGKSLIPKKEKDSE